MREYEYEVDCMKVTEKGVYRSVGELGESMHSLE